MSNLNPNMNPNQSHRPKQKPNKKNKKRVKSEAHLLALVEAEIAKKKNDADEPIRLRREVVVRGIACKMSCRKCHNAWTSPFLEFYLRRNKGRFRHSKQFCAVCHKAGEGLQAGAVAPTHKFLDDLAKRAAERFCGVVPPKSARKGGRPPHRGDLCELCMGNKYCPGRRAAQEEDEDDF